MADAAAPSATESISVYARLRSGSDNSDCEIATVPGNVGTVRARTLEFHLDHAFDAAASQADMYGVVGCGESPDTQED